MAQKKKWSAAAKFEIALLALKGETTIEHYHAGESLAGKDSSEASSTTS